LEKNTDFKRLTGRLKLFLIIGGNRAISLNEHRDVIGNVKAFDGNILYLPIRLPNQVIISWCF
jgi:hypothetical protein